MPKIPRHFAQQSIPGATGAPRADPRTFGAPGRALEEAGTRGARFFGALAERAREARQTQDLAAAGLEASRQLTDLEIELALDTDWRTVNARFEQRATAIGQQIADGLDDGAVRTLFERRFGERFESARVGIARHAIQQQVTEGRATLDAGSTEYARQAALADNDVVRAQALADGVAAIRGAAAAGIINAVEAGNRERAFLGSVAEAEVDALIRTAPAAAVQALEDPEAFAALSLDSRSMLLRRAEDAVTRQAAEARRLAQEARAVARARLAPRLDNERAMLLAGIEPPEPVTAEEIAAAYPAEAAATIWVELGRLRELGTRIASVAGMTPAEQIALLEQEAPVPGPDFAAATERHEILTGVVEEDREVAREILTPRLVNERAMLLAGIQPPEPVTEDEIAAAYAPEDAARVWRELSRLRELGAEVGSVPGMTPEEQQALLAGAAPEAGGEFAVDVEQQDVLRRAIEIDQSARGDAGRYAMTHSPEVRAAFEAAAEDPSLLGDALRRSLAYQEEIGIPAADRQPLMAETAADIVARWRETDNRVDRLNLLQSAVELGDDAVGRRVLDQLVRAGLPADAAYALEVARVPDRRNHAATLLADLSVDAPTLETDADRRIAERIRNDYGDDGVGAVLAQRYAWTADPRDQQRFSREVAMLTHVASVRAGTGADGDDTAAAAYADAFAHLQPLLEDDLVAAVVPADVRAGSAEAFLEALRQSTIELMDDAMLAEILDQVPDPARTEQWRETLIEDLRWMNHGDGLALFELRSGRILRNRDGAPLAFVPMSNLQTGPPVTELPTLPVVP